MIICYKCIHIILIFKYEIACELSVWATLVINCRTKGIQSIFHFDVLFISSAIGNGINMQTIPKGNDTFFNLVA